ncbi:MAG: hypothetical protein ACOYL6_17255 [Bacteriovoracaceae bacterium]
MKTKIWLIGLLSMSLIGCGNKAEESSGGEFKKVKGTISYIFEQIIPTAHAAGASYCSSIKDPGATNYLNVYLVVNGSSVKICDANVASNGEYELLVNEKELPSDGVLKIEAKFNGLDRASFIDKNEIESGANIAVNKLTSLGVELVKDEAFDKSKFEKAKQFITSSFGAELSQSVSPEVNLFLQRAIGSSIMKSGFESFKASGAIVSGVMASNIEAIKQQLQQVKIGQLSAQVKIAASGDNASYSGRNPSSNGQKF